MCLYLMCFRLPLKNNFRLSVMTSLSLVVSVRQMFRLQPQSKEARTACDIQFVK